MKNNLLIKLLAVFLTGTTLIGVGCKDYDDDIKDLSNRIDDLSGKIELKADASAVSALQQKLEGVDFSAFVTNTQLTEELAKYVKEAELDTKVGDLGYVKTSDLQTLLSSVEFSTAVIDAVKAQMESLDIWGSIQSDVKTEIQTALDALDIPQVDINAITEAIVKQIYDDPEVKDIKEAIKKMLGEEYGEVLNDYVTIDDLDSSVANKLAEENSELKASIIELINASLDGENGGNSAWLAENDLSTVFATYQKQIESLWSAVGNLASRIQSLVYVPTTQDGVAYFKTASLGSEKLILGQKATMSFRVSPASLAQAIADGYNEGTVQLAILPEKVTRADAEPAFEIEGEVTAEDGKITMLVNSTYEYTATETYSIALQVISESSVTKPSMSGEIEAQADETIDTGVEFTSAYVPTSCIEDSVLDKIALVKAGEKEGEYVPYDTAKGAVYELEYDNTTVQHTLMGEYFYAYKVDEKTYLTLDEAAAKYHWDVTPEATPVIARTAFSDGTATELALDPEDPMKDDAAKAQLVKVGLKKAEVTNIDKKVVDAAAMYVKVGEKKVDTKMIYAATLKITRKNLGTIENLNATINWAYDQAKSTDDKQFGGYKGNAYTTGYVIIDNAYDFLTKERFEQLKSALLSDPKWTVEGDKDFKDGIEVIAFGDSDPYIEGDSKAIKFTVTNYKNGNGTINISKEIAVAKDAMVTLKGTITFNGLADLSYDITNPEAEFVIDGANMFVTIDNTFFNTMYGKLPEGQKYFASVDQFKEFMGNSVLNMGRQAADATKNIAEAGLKSDANGTDVKLRAFFKSNDVDFSVADSYSYTAFYTKEPAVDAHYAVPGTDPIFKINLTGTITIKNKSGYSLKSGANLFQGEGIEVPYMIAQGKIEGTDDKEFKIANVDLTSGYSKAAEAGATGTAVVTYTLKTTAPKGYTGPMPTIDGGISGTTGVFDWNGCQLDKVEVEAALTVDGVTIDTKVFEVVLEKPIDFDSWVAFVTKTQTVTTNTKAEVNLYAVMNTKDANKKNVALDIFGNNLMTDTALEATYVKDEVYGLKCSFAAPVYKSTNGAETFDNFSFADGVITYSANNAPLAGEVTATVTVTFTYKYAVTYNSTTQKYEPVKFTKDITVIFKNAQ